MMGFRSKKNKIALIFTTCTYMYTQLQRSAAEIQVAEAVAEEVVQVQGEDSTRHIQDVDSG
jgi:hypothetical protein